MLNRRIMAMMGLAGLILALAGCRQQSEPTTLRINIDPSGFEGGLMRQLAARYEAERGVRVVVINGPDNASERIMQYQMFLGARTSTIDVFQVDVIWPGILEEHLMDLGPALGESIDDFFPGIVANNTVAGRVVAVPWFADAGMLFYRRDLLEKHGFAKPPETWDELESMAATIQAAERGAGNAQFWGFVWQGAKREALTCNALEWQASHGGGTVVDATGTITLDNPNTRRAIERARGWIGTISPPAVLEMGEDTSGALFKEGNAAFTRNWVTFYRQFNAEGSAVAGKVGFAPLPRGEGGRASTIGGWQLAVSRYSKYPQEASDLVLWLTSREIQLERARLGGFMPARISAYGSKELRNEIPWFEELSLVFRAGTARPSTATGTRYNDVSTAYYSGIHAVLSGTQSTDEGVRRIVQDLRRILAEDR